MKKIIIIFLLCMTMLQYTHATVQAYNLGTVGWYLQQSRESKNMMILGVIKGLRMYDYMHQYSLNEKNKRCPAQIPHYPNGVGYDAIIQSAESYMAAHPECHERPIEDIVAMTFVILNR